MGVTVPLSDVLLFHTHDGGEIEFIGGQPTMCDGLETSAYLSLFGGNEDDGGLDATERLQWWGNFGEDDPAKQYRSETQYLLRSLPAVPANLRRIEDAAGRDLAWMADLFASSIVVSASMPRFNTLSLSIAITVESGTKYKFQFTVGWGEAA